MRTLPTTDEYYPDLLVVRTDYRDQRAWDAVRAALAEPWGPKGEESVQQVVYVDDPEWAEASAEDVLAALTGGEDGGESGWSVVFLADRVTMESDLRELLAVNTDPEDDCREFRTEPRQTPHDIHCNLSLGNMDFEDFAPHEFF
ncbi:DUF6924 domain-containing protein [Streptomyces polygonati]|uniref:DUF6924 domain-containing protein n=1 Tax=Streptomyces polygonati TaxID=1617087 RepID=A0ABV8HU78_9ACTN